MAAEQEKVAWVWGAAKFLGRQADKAISGTASTSARGARGLGKWIGRNKMKTLNIGFGGAVLGGAAMAPPRLTQRTPSVFAAPSATGPRPRMYGAAA